MEWPFAVELDYGFVRQNALVGDDVLAGVVALTGAVPEKQTAEKGYFTCLYQYKGSTDGGKVRREVYRPVHGVGNRVDTREG